MNALEVFNYDGADVRTILIDGDPWFSAVDVCAALEIGNTTQAMTRLDADERTLISNEGRDINVVSEAGLFSLILGSRKPEARAFKRWVTHEVLPSIRRTGSYVVETPEQLMSRALVTAQGIIASKDQQITALAPRAEAWDELASAEGDYSVADAAKILARAGVKTGPQRLFDQLAGIRWIHRAHDGKWRAYASAVDNGYLTEKPQSHYHPRTSELILDAPQVRVTVRGLERLRQRLGAIETGAAA
ncbi:MULTISPECIES: phage antirepressor KilAC domain-containing protein [unclassified Microbacterium]|uniref:phage antirepressor KilAC domain-containing protein n=1 Tax=unclassified Microbacterium TaxID=2609290 RepID=UPI001604C253|nr:MULTISPECIES: phage antirepressor KilAC domain-containing protein [unclassified Microbacterium]QNA93230.1 phage antirepressor protein [Microbacterium sp. Se63.02b]QYM63438.1 phage antirepressor KilAC domain-containing protein [Microbacterium sp. Se5.02b]